MVKKAANNPDTKTAEEDRMIEGFQLEHVKETWYQYMHDNGYTAKSHPDVMVMIKAVLEILGESRKEYLTIPLDELTTCHVQIKSFVNAISYACSEKGKLAEKLENLKNPE